MRIVSLVAVCFLALCSGCPTSSLSGVWTLNQAKSDFGMVIAPEQLVVRLERTGGRLAMWRITTDLEGQHFVYREYSLDGNQQPLVDVARSTSSGIVFPIESNTGTRIDERWQVSKVGRLIIHRSIPDGPRTVHQRLVLDPSTRVVE
jgi:hypothetical protein